MQAGTVAGMLIVLLCTRFMSAKGSVNVDPIL